MRSNFRFWISFFILILIATGLAAVNLHQPWREAIRDHIIHEKREILAEARGNLVLQNTNTPDIKRQFIALKILTQDSIQLEVFEVDPKSGQPNFRARTSLPERRDAYFTYQGSATNLLLLDANNDGALEIIVPAFDENLVPRVHAYRFNDETSSIELLDIQSIQR